LKPATSQGAGLDRCLGSGYHNRRAAMGSPSVVGVPRKMVVLDSVSHMEPTADAAQPISEARIAARPGVAVVFHSLPHYRATVFTRMLCSRSFRYRLFADERPERDGGIRQWQPPREVFTPCRYFMAGPILVQPGIIPAALGRDAETVILLGVSHWPMTWIAAALARLSGKRVLFWTHGWIKRERGFRGWLRNRFYRLADGLLLYGDTARRIGIEEGFDPRRLHVVYNSLDHDTHTKLRAPLDITAAKQIRREWFGNEQLPIVVCCSRLTTVRRLDLLVDAAALLRRRGTPVGVLLIGDGPARAALAAQAAERGVPIHFYGECYDEAELYRLVSCCNATVAPGKVGLTAIQSLSFGTPVITHGDPDDQMPEWEAVVPGKTGSLFRPNDVEDLADTIAQWTRAPLPDESHRRDCFRMVDHHWNPDYQLEVIERALQGLPAREPAQITW
jgi:glycosyltransferase involved in cell wall biosynthesis